MMKKVDLYFLQTHYYINEAIGITLMTREASLSFEADIKLQQ